MKSKTAFESFPNLIVRLKKLLCRQRDIRWQHFHRRNQEPTTTKIPYCIVNAHHQNGRAEKWIRDLQDQARVLVMHAMHKCPEVITPNLWQYAVKLSNEVQNHSPCTQNGLIPIATFPRQIKYPRSVTYMPLDVHHNYLSLNCKARIRLTRQLQNWHVPGPIKIVCKQFSSHLVTNHQTHITSIPCYIWWTL